MNASEHLESLKADAVTLAGVAGRNLYVEIPTCPGWCMADLVWHTGMAVHGAAAMIPIRAGHDGGPFSVPQAPSDDELVEWFEAGAAKLIAVLGEFDPDDTLGREWVEYGYPGPSLYRHYAREVGLHRWDAERAHGRPSPLDDGLAADWLDGVLITWLPTAARRGNQAQGEWAGETILFRRTGASSEDAWLVTLNGPGAVEVTRNPAPVPPPSLEVVGSAPGLLLVVMNRLSPAAAGASLIGDITLLDRWAAEIRYGRPASGAHWLGSPRPSARAGGAAELP